MGRFFSLDSPAMRFMGKVADLICLNFLALFCCIPIFTIGASLTALNYVALKIVRDEEDYITRAFFKSFKENFKQATIAWLIMLVMMVVLAADFVIYNFSEIEMEIPSWVKTALLIVSFILMFATMHVFPLLARFENTIKSLFKNSLFMGLLTIIRTVAMMLCWLIPVAATVLVPRILPVIVCFGLSGPVYLNALLYNKTFKKYEPEEKEELSDEWHVEEEETEEIEETEEPEVEVEV